LATYSLRGIVIMCLSYLTITKLSPSRCRSHGSLLSFEQAIAWVIGRKRDASSHPPVFVDTLKSIRHSARPPKQPLPTRPRVGPRGARVVCIQLWQQAGSRLAPVRPTPLAASPLNVASVSIRSQRFLPIRRTINNARERLWTKNVRLWSPVNSPCLLPPCFTKLSYASSVCEDR
jgi:hypothetical protein